MERIYYIKSFLLINIFIFLFGNADALKAQDLNAYNNLIEDDYSNLTLPPLDILFENAKNAPAYKYILANEQLERKVLSKEKRAWLGFFSIRGSYQYGTFTNDGSYNDVYQSAIQSFSKMSQHLYSAGAGVNIPLNDLFDLGGRVKRQKIVVRSYELLKEQKFEEIKKEIITLYTASNAQLNILKLRAESLVLASIEYSIVEKNFANGTADSKELATEKERQSVAKERYEGTRAELHRSLMILELISHTPIIRK